MSLGKPAECRLSRSPNPTPQKSIQKKPVAPELFPSAMAILTVTKDAARDPSRTLPSYPHLQTVGSALAIPDCSLQTSPCRLLPSSGAHSLHVTRALVLPCTHCSPGFTLCFLLLSCSSHSEGMATSHLESPHNTVPTAMETSHGSVGSIRSGSNCAPNTPGTEPCGVIHDRWNYGLASLARK